MTHSFIFKLVFLTACAGFIDLEPSQSLLPVEESPELAPAPYLPSPEPSPHAMLPATAPLPMQVPEPEHPAGDMRSLAARKLSASDPGVASALAAAAAAAPQPSSASWDGARRTDSELGICPAFGAKAVCGRRPTMEDKWTAVPCLVQVRYLPAACR